MRRWCTGRSSHVVTRAARLASRRVTRGIRHMTRNLHARDDFSKGDIGYVRGHVVSKATASVEPVGSTPVTALQDVRAGTNGWFDDNTSRTTHT
jgi:hypothetical protein